MLVFFVLMIGILGTLLLSVGALTYLVVILAGRRPRELSIVAGGFCGYAGGALFVWSLVPRDWMLPLWTTLAASVNAEKYGHAVEHPAEGIVVWMLFGAVVGSVIGGVLLATATGYARRRYRSAHPTPGLLHSRTPSLGAKYPRPR